MIIVMSIAMLYTLMISIFDTQLGMLFATIFLVSTVVAMKLVEAMGLDKKIDEWLEK